MMINADQYTSNIAKQCYKLDNYYKKISNENIKKNFILLLQSKMYNNFVNDVLYEQIFTDIALIQDKQIQHHD